VLLCRASEFDDDRRTHNTIAYDAAVEGVQIVACDLTPPVDGAAT
jgi:hypothetical protein